jgi:nitrous oxidase accessory protein
MNRVRVGVVSVVALASVALLAVGPAALVGSARPQSAASTPASCAPSAGTVAAATATSSSAATGMAGMVGMAGMADDPTHHSMQELRDQLARTPSGGTLRVQPGVYRGALVIDHPVTLVGVGHPTLLGDGTGTVLTIRAPGTTVRDLMVEGSGPGPVGNPAGVSVQADDVVVKDLHIRDTYTGIWVEGVKNARITDNLIEGRKTVSASGETPRTGGDMANMVMGTDKGAAMDGRGDGVSLFDAVRPVVTGNTITDARDGVYLEYGSGTKIECNSVAGGRYAIHGMYGESVTVADNHFATGESGVVMMYGGPVTLEANVIRDEQSAATGFGALLLDVANVRLVRNVIVSNRVGLQIDGPLGTLQPTAVELNTIALNQVGVGLYPSANATLSQNSLVQNTVQVLGMGPEGSGGVSPWSRDGVGNYWSDYRGYAGSGSLVGVVPQVESATAGLQLANDPTLLALVSSPAYTLLRTIEVRTSGQQPVSVDPHPILDPRSPALPSAAVHAALGSGLVGGISLALCSFALLRYTRRRQLPSGRKKP